MPFTVAQLTAFWTSQAQMGLTAHTRVQMAAEGLATPNDFEDFPEWDDLEDLFKQLLKPVKIPEAEAFLKYSVWLAREHGYLEDRVKDPKTDLMVRIPMR